MPDVSRVTGPLGPFAGGFVADLSRQGFKPETVGTHVSLVAGLSRWLASEGIAASALSSEVAERYAAARRAAGYRNCVTVEALEPLLGYLRGLGVAPPAAAGVASARSRCCWRAFGGTWPRARPGARGREGYVQAVRPFLARLEGRTGWTLAGGRGARCGVRGRAVSARSRAARRR